MTKEEKNIIEDEVHARYDKKIKKIFVDEIKDIFPEVDENDVIVNGYPGKESDIKFYIDFSCLTKRTQASKILKNVIKRQNIYVKCELGRLQEQLLDIMEMRDGLFAEIKDMVDMLDQLSYDNVVDNADNLLKHIEDIYNSKKQ